MDILLICMVYIIILMSKGCVIDKSETLSNYVDCNNYYIYPFTKMGWGAITNPSSIDSMNINYNIPIIPDTCGLRSPTMQSLMFSCKDNTNNTNEGYLYLYDSTDCSGDATMIDQIICDAGNDIGDCDCSCNKNPKIGNFSLGDITSNSQNTNCNDNYIFSIALGICVRDHRYIPNNSDKSSNFNYYHQFYCGQTSSEQYYAQMNTFSGHSGITSCLDSSFKIGSFDLTHTCSANVIETSLYNDDKLYLDGQVISCTETYNCGTNKSNTIKLNTIIPVIFIISLYIISF